MTTTFQNAIQVCGLSRKEASIFLEVSEETIRSWCKGRRQVPDGIWSLLASLYSEILDSSDQAVDFLNKNGADDRIYQFFQADSGLMPLPEGSVNISGAIALLTYIIENDE